MKVLVCLLFSFISHMNETYLQIEILVYVHIFDCIITPRLVKIHQTILFVTEFFHHVLSMALTGFLDFGLPCLIVSPMKFSKRVEN